MKTKLLFLLSVVLTCLSCKQQTPKNALLEFDVTADYPERTLNIQDVADVEYMVLKSDTLYTKFFYLTDKYILTMNVPERSYQIFDRQGNFISEISKSGGGPEDYYSLGMQFVDDATNEVFIFSFPDKIQIYDIQGNFKRTLRVYEANTVNAMNFSFENMSIWGDYIIFYDKSSTEAPYILLSKTTGDKLQIPMHLTNLVKTTGEKELEGGMIATLASDHTSNVACGENLYLTSPSTDTIYVCKPDLTYTPYFVRKPSVHEMETPILLSGFMDTQDYAFFSTEKLEFDFDTFEDNEKHNYMLDKKSGQYLEINVENSDYEGQKIILSPADVLYEKGNQRSSNPKVGVIALDSEELLEADKEGKVKGKLKEALDKLTDEPFVLMILKMKA